MDKPKQQEQKEFGSTEETTMKELHPPEERDGFEQFIGGYYADKKEKIDVPLSRLMANNAHIYLPQPSQKENNARPKGWFAKWSSWWLGGGLGTLAAAACVFFLLPSSTLPTSRVDAGGPAPEKTLGPANPAWLKPRGDGTPHPQLEVALKRGKGKVRPLQSGSKVNEHDKLRIIVSWKRDGYVFLLHKDAKDVWSPLYPSSPKEPGISIEAGQGVALPGSLEVTGESNGDEWFVGCFSLKKINFTELSKSLMQEKKVQVHCSHIKRFVLSRPKRKTR